MSKALPTLAERLGFKASDRLWIIHGDDMGMCHSANKATARALELGGISSASIMVPCPWFLEAAAWARENPRADLGIHLTLTSEWKHYRWQPVTSTSLVPSLIDAQGYMWASMADVVTHAKPEEVEIELRAQIERALAFGIQATHIDSHMGTLFHPKFFEIYTRLSREYRLPALLLEPTPATMASAEKRGFGDYPRFVEKLKQDGYLFLDGLIGIDKVEGLDARRAQFENLIRTLPVGAYQTIVHLNDDDDEARHIAGSWRVRAEEFVIFTDPRTKALIEEEDVKLIDFRTLKNYWRSTLP